MPFSAAASLTISPIFDEKESEEHVYELESGAVKFYCVVQFKEDEIVSYDIFFSEWFREWESDMEDLVRGWFEVEVPE